MATALTLNTMTGVAGTGAEAEVTIPVGTRFVDVYAVAEDLLLSYTGSDAVGTVTTRTTVPAGSGWKLLVPGTDGGTILLSTAVALFIEQATGAGTAQFTVVS